MEILTRATINGLSDVRLVGRNTNEIVKIETAMDQAEDLGLDLVLVSAEVKPPVVRIQDFKKIEYERKKARKSQKTHTSTLKEIHLKINISDHDLEVKKNKIDKFLGKGDKVKVSVRLKGREREHPERAHELLNRLAETIECKVTKLGGPIAIIILEPLKGSSKS